MGAVLLVLEVGVQYVHTRWRQSSAVEIVCGRMWRAQKLRPTNQWWTNVAKLKRVVKPPTSEDHQDVSIALLPFFHIYAMTTVMSMGLHYGLKLVTLPKFEPETYLKALVQYKVSLTKINS